jgi:hypothetical protein
MRECENAGMREWMNQKEDRIKNGIYVTNLFYLDSLN